MSHRPGGGIKSRNVVSKPVKTGVGGRGVNKNWVSQIGQSLGDRVQNSIEGGGGSVLKNVRADVYKPPNFQPVKLGNALVNNVGQGGPGKGRAVYQSGSQRGLQNPKPRPSGTFE